MTLAAAVSDLDFTWIDGVDGKDVLSKVLPAGDRDNSTKFLGNIGSWRAHMNALRA